MRGSRKLRASAAVVAICGLGAASGAQAAPFIEEIGPMPTPASAPCEIEFDSTGRYLWIEQIASNSMGRLDTQTNRIDEFPLPTPGAIPGGMELGPDGNIWFPEVLGNQMVRLNTATGEMTEFPIPINSLTGSAFGTALSDDVTFGTDGRLYFTLIGRNAIGQMNIQTGEIKEIPLKIAGAAPAIIQRGPGDTVIFGTVGSNKIFAYDTKTEKLRMYSVPSFSTQGITTGPDGAIWYSAALTQRIGRVDPETGDVREISIFALRRQNGLPELPVSPGNPIPFPTTMRTGGDGAIYFSQNGLLYPSLGNKIGRYDPATGAYADLETPSPFSTACDLNTQKPDEVWAGLFVANKVARIKITPKAGPTSARTQVAEPAARFRGRAYVRSSHGVAEIVARFSRALEGADSSVRLAKTVRSGATAGTRVRSARKLGRRGRHCYVLRVAASSTVARAPRGWRVGLGRGGVVSASTPMTIERGRPSPSWRAASARRLGCA